MVSFSSTLSALWLSFSISRSWSAVIALGWCVVVVLIRDQWTTGPRRSPHPSRAMICGRSIVVRMPGAAAHTMGTALTARLAV